jgi:hypothetical protein
MSEKSLQLGNYVITSADEIFSFDQLIEAVDDALMEEMAKDASGVMLKLYYFFDTINNPIDPREFYEFLGSLSWQEHFELIEFGHSLLD